MRIVASRMTCDKCGGTHVRIPVLHPDWVIGLHECSSCKHRVNQLHTLDASLFEAVPLSGDGGKRS